MFYNQYVLTDDFCSPIIGSFLIGDWATSFMIAVSWACFFLLSQVGGYILDVALNAVRPS